ncbi:hypothetical protein WKI68_04910 [Streptomyces sp. MS1.HAVA.3]|uniref:Transcriptional regulator n=1 Tax=Streptomyces caledonius TaxID=3134107 RepID=A0ABU8U0W9_9ACTN
MSEAVSEAAPVSVSPSYAAGRLAQALRTSVLHEDTATRERARSRARQWRQVLAGISSGSLTIGSRTPVTALPAWVTPEVVAGGFATGSATAGGPLLPYEEEAARLAGVPATRSELFAHFLTEDGLVRLWSLLDSGHYEVRVPEEAALATVAWLVRAGTSTPPPNSSPYCGRSPTDCASCRAPPTAPRPGWAPCTAGPSARPASRSPAAGPTRPWRPSGRP